MPQNNHDFYNNSEYEVFLVEYRGNFSEEIKKVSYASGNVITKTLAIVAVKSTDLYKLAKDVPSIVFVNFREMIVLEEPTAIEYSAQSTSNIGEVKNNPYLNLSGSGVLIGIVDTGIDYLNKEFVLEDGKTRIEAIWDQTIPSNESINNVFIGSVYNSEQINKALEAQQAGKDPYEIVPSRDTNGHGTQLAGIVGARGYDKRVQGVANDSNFVIVKLIESAALNKSLRENNIKDVSVYSSAEVLAGLEYLKEYALNIKKPIVILMALGSTDYTHDGNNTLSRYINDITAINGIIVVTGTGNQGEADGHVSGNISNEGDIKTNELVVSQEQKTFQFKIYVRRPNKLDVNIISPSGQKSGFIPSKINKTEKVNYILEDTILEVKYFVPDNITGLEIIILTFNNIKPGIWKIQLKGVYITDGRYDIWLQPYETIPDGTKFLTPDPYITLTDTACAKRAISVAYYNQINNSIVSKSGKGYPYSNFFKPDIAAPGVNIITTNIGNTTKVVSGSSVAAAIVTGCCALMLQWGIVNGNDTTMFSTSLINYLITGATRKKEDIHPNPEWGYGRLDLLGAFNALSGTITATQSRVILTSSREYIEDKNDEYYVGNLLVRHPN